MQIKICSKERYIHFCIMPLESSAMAILLQKTLTEQREMVQNVPHYRDGFFEEFALADKICTLKFGFGHLEFVGAFIEAIIQAYQNQGLDSTDFEKLLIIIYQFQSMEMAEN